jgi:hypothetical protein
MNTLFAPRLWAKPAQAAPTNKVLIENLTARRVVVEPKLAGATSDLVLGPFEARELSCEAAEQLKIADWERQSLLCVTPCSANNTAQDWCGLLLNLMVWITAIALPVSVLLNAWIWLTSGAAFATASDTFSTALIGITTATILLSAALRRLNDLLQAVVKSCTFALTILIGFGLTAIPLALWLVASRAGGQKPNPSDVFMHFLQWYFMGLASVLPAIMYFLFYRQKVRSLRESFLRNIVRLNPNIYTISDAEAQYGARVDDVYGADDSPRSVIGTHLPILISTVLIALGWVIALTPIETADAVQTLFRPQATAISFGFLGAYFFALNMIFRRYVRSDLGPKAYNHISMRLLTTVVLVWMVSRIPGLTDSVSALGSTGPAAPLLLFAFFIGVVPETAIVALQDTLRGIPPLKNIIPSLEEPLPLTDLDGMTLYDRARLLEEGIENIENLAHHNFVDLMLWTRLPTSRLVDLVDQAILYLHVKNPRLDAKNLSAVPTAPTDDLATLRKYGIRTATDLIRAYTEASKQENAHASMLSLLGDASDRQGLSRLDSILKTLADDDWVAWLRLWHGRTTLGQGMCYLKDVYTYPDDLAIMS